MQLSIRSRRPRDLDRCVNTLSIVHKADGYPLNWPADPVGWLCPDRMLHAWVAEGAAGSVAGHLALAQVAPASGRPEPRPTANVSRLFVVPALRRQTVGRRLLAAAQKWAGDRGFDLILDVVADKGSAAVALYESTGWQFSYVSRADWTRPGGEPVRLLHYRYAVRAPATGARPGCGGHGGGTG